MNLWIAAFLAFGLVMAAMAVGVIFGTRQIKGSCGGLNSLASKVGLPLCECGGDPKECKMIRVEEPPEKKEEEEKSLLTIS